MNSNMEGNGEVMALSTSVLEAKLRSLRDQSNQHSQALTQKLATSQSGQNLLHIGSSLSTLPPDLYALLAQLHPVLSAAEGTQEQYLQQLQKLVTFGNNIRAEKRRIDNAAECADLYQDLLAAELDVKRDAAKWSQEKAKEPDSTTPNTSLDYLDHISSLERCAHTSLCLVQDLQSSTAQASSLTSKASSSSKDSTGISTTPSMRPALLSDTEQAQFLMKMAPRIRRLESNACLCLMRRLEQVLQKLKHNEYLEDDNSHDGKHNDFLIIEHCMRGLILLGKGKDVESLFARVAIMPLIRTKLSMGRLDQGGPRGECAGLFSLLGDIASSISSIYGPLLRSAESMFDLGDDRVDIDLVTAGVWVPIATALVSDAGIKMAIFSPGIASVLQTNYTAVDTFLSDLASTLLKVNKVASTGDQKQLDDLYFRPIISVEKIRRAQSRIFSHSVTSDFSKKWNLPIYYQLRYGECCTRLNKAIEGVRSEGWHADLFTGSNMDTQLMEFGLKFFAEVYDVMLVLWKPDVILRSLTHRFLRGAVQLISRTVAFVRASLKEGGIKALPLHGLDGEQVTNTPAEDQSNLSNNVEAVAAVAWDLHVIETMMAKEYVETIVSAVSQVSNAPSKNEELHMLVSDVMMEASEQLRPVVELLWNDVIVTILTGKCSGPLSAVKGVAATYRMTNRPPPTQASPFVASILKPLKNFDDNFSSRAPQQIGVAWKKAVVTTVADRYSAAVEELISTVQRTEVALKNRKSRKTAAGVVSDGEKVKRQLYLDYLEFHRNVQELNVDVSSVEGLRKLQILTAEGAEGMS